jgi:hypothetical protein
MQEAPKIDAGMDLLPGFDKGLIQLFLPCRLAFTLCKTLLQVLQNNQIDRARWDACIAHSNEGVVYALSWYLDLVSPGWEGIIDEQQGKYSTVVPLPKGKKFGVSFLRQPLFCQQLGAFSILKEVAPADLASIAELLCRRFTHIREYSFNTANPALPPFPQANLRVHDHYTHYLSLDASYQNLYRHYSRDRKLNLKRAQKANLEIFESNDIRPLIAIFREDAAQKIYGGVAEAAYELLLSLYSELRRRGLATLLYTRNAAGEVNAGCLFVSYRNRITYLFNAATRKGRDLNGRSLMIDKIIREHAGQNVVLDFESPAGVEAITYFYQGFGAQPVRFQTIHYNNLPFLIRLAKATRMFWYQKILGSAA